MPIGDGEYQVLAKLGHDGSVVWIQRFAPIAGWLDVRYVAVAADGTIYVSAYANGSVSLGGPVLTTTAEDHLIAAFEPDGAHRWSKRLGKHGVPEALVTDANSNAVFLAGYTGGDGTANAQTFDTVVVTELAVTIPDLLGIVVEPGGRVLRAYKAWARYAQYLPVRAVVRRDNGISLVLSENYLIACMVVGCVPDWGQRARYGDLDADGLLLRGDQMWPESLRLHDVTVGQDGTIFVLGTSTGTLDFFGAPVTAEKRQAFIATLAEPAAGGTTSIVVQPWFRVDDGRLAALPDGGYAVLGLFHTSIEVNGATYTAARDHFVARLGRDGSTRWAQQIATP